MTTTETNKPTHEARGFAGRTPLPSGWCWVTVPELLTDKLCNGISVKGKDSPPGVPALKLGAMGDSGFDYSDKRYIPIDADTARSLAIREGDFFVARGNGSLHLVGRGTLAQTPPEQVVFPDTMIRIRLADEGSLRKYVSVLWQSAIVRRQIEARARTTAGIYKISQQDIEELQLPLPPLNEQGRIVVKVEELFSDLDVAVATLERVRAKLKRYRAAVLKAAIDGKLTADWRARHPNTEPASTLLDRILAERRSRWEDAQRAKYTVADKEPPKGWQAKYPEPVAPETAKLPQLPDGWCWASVDQLSEIQGGIQKQPKRTPASNAYPFLRVANVYRGRLDLSDVHRIELFGGELERLRLEKGDLLIVEGNGSITEIGRSAIWTGEIEDCVHQNHLIRVRLLLCDPRYFDAYWNSPFGNRQVMAVAASTSGLYTLSVSKVSSLPVPLPPFGEQAAIIEEVERRLTVVDQATAQVDANLKRAARLRQGILKRAFEGKLVPQVATDEPASVLLDRIRQRRSQPTTQPAGTKLGKPARRTPVRAVLEVVGRQTAYIVAHAVTPFGRTIMAKLHYLAQTHLGLPLGLKFKREKYGPFDEDIHKAERVGRKRGWFDFKDQAKEKERTTYSKTSGTPAAAAEAAALLSDRRVAFDQLLAHFATLDSAGAELFATVYAAWNDLLLDERPANEAAITAEVYGWHPSKRGKFTPESITTQVAWMRVNGYAPTGQGERTAPPGQKSVRRGRRKGGAA